MGRRRFRGRSHPRGGEARRDAAATQGQAVGVRLGVEAGSRSVSVALTARGLVRDPPEARMRGWAIKPPPRVGSIQ